MTLRGARPQVEVLAAPRSPLKEDLSMMDRTLESGRIATDEAVQAAEEIVFAGPTGPASAVERLLAQGLVDERAAHHRTRVRRQPTSVASPATPAGRQPFDWRHAAGALGALVGAATGFLLLLLMTIVVTRHAGASGLFALGVVLVVAGGGFAVWSAWWSRARPRAKRVAQ